MRLISFLLIFFIFIAACSEELPPSPPKPGQITGNMIVGKAPSWAAQAQGIQILPVQVKKGQSAAISIAGFTVVYPKAYYYTKKTGAWKEFALQGNLNGNWIFGPATGLLQVSDDFIEGKAYIIIYACKSEANSWDCNNNHWMLEEFTVSLETTTAQSTPTQSNPSLGDLPVQVSTAEMVINNTIPPFWILGTLAVPDNFGEIGVRRYDAKYRSANGLEVLVYVFDFNSRAELLQALQDQFASVLKNGITENDGKKLAVFVDAQPHAVALWTNGKRMVYIDTFGPSANKQIIDRYMELYPSDLVP
ncbi:MAG TPA: hypothetical protein VJJ82_03075 [Candidatus Nanoarchaeia archaeon]|nr:hypothetical protein [Candidatus Nanoarchaeia archaeon]